MRKLPNTHPLTRLDSKLETPKRLGFDIVMASAALRAERDQRGREEDSHRPQRGRGALRGRRR